MMIFEDNDKEIKDAINAVTVAEVFTHLKKEVDEYYGESNQDRMLSEHS